MTVDHLASVRLTFPMIPEIDIWRAAAIMIKRYKDQADLAPARRADEYCDKGERDGPRTWLAILKAIDQLRTVQPGEARN